MSVQKRLASFRYAVQGLNDLVKTQPNARIHLAAAIVATGLGFYFKVSASEGCLLALAIALVFALEAMNTAVEYIVDLVSPEYHPLAGKAKDAAAAAVLIASLGALGVGLVIFGPKLSGG